MSVDVDVWLQISDILDALPFYVMLVDEDHHILQANRATHDALGVSPQAIVGKYCPEVIHGVKEPWYACPLEEALETEQIVEREAIDRATGHWIRSSIYPIARKTPDGRRLFFHMVSDVTDRKQAEELAETAHLALKNFAAYVVKAQEEERRHIALELHDQTIQKVVVFNRELEDLLAQEGLPSSVIERLREIRATSDLIAEELRAFARDLRPPALDDLGLFDSISKLLADLSDRLEIRSSLRLVGKERRLPPDMEVGLFRIAQEALRNIERHSGATKVDVVVEFEPGAVSMRVNDNGMGFSVVSAGQNLAGGHFGLIGMQERAEMAGGKLEVQSAPQEGTRILVHIPA